ncbi:MAG: nitroreductase family deazaflavin-dependent oxidoreductase [Acidimicrobiales bacterium]
MEADVARALATDVTIDLTTTGRRSGRPRRIEIWLLVIDGHLYLTGTPGPRDWFANLLARPACTIHLKQRVRVDIAALAHPVTDAQLRRHVLGHRDASWYREQGDDLDFLLADAPLVELQVDGWPDR